MFSFFAAGGVVMVPVLGLGLATAAAGACHALAPARAWRDAAASLRAALLFAAAAATGIDLVAVAAHAPELAATTDELAKVALVGFGEALAPAILGAGFAAVGALLAAAGDLRAP